MTRLHPSGGKRVAVIGGGPAGLMAAESARAAGAEVDLYEGKASVGRKFLIAGRGGLNLTHSESRPAFDQRYREAAARVSVWLDRFDANALRHWAHGLGIGTFIGSSGRVFPLDMKAAPLLRAWVHRLRENGVRFHVGHRWMGWQGESLLFRTPAGEALVRADATVLALGGGSWPQLGSDGAWQDTLRAQGAEVRELAPSNCGFDVDWTPHLSERHAGAPLKPVAAITTSADGRERSLQGECVISASGIEGSLVYALSADLREAIAAAGEATLCLDLLPGRSLAQVLQAMQAPRNGRSLGEHLRRRLHLSPAKIALVFEIIAKAEREDMPALAARIKRLPLRLRRPRPLAEAISSAGGVAWSALDDKLMLRARPGVYCAGEMLDWEAPTGGYLLTACFASGRVAGQAAGERALGSRRIDNGR